MQNPMKLSETVYHEGVRLEDYSKEELIDAIEDIKNHIKLLQADCATSIKALREKSVPFKEALKQIKADEKEVERKAAEERGDAPIRGTRCKDRADTDWHCQSPAYKSGYCKRHDPARRHAKAECTEPHCWRYAQTGSEFCLLHNVTKGCIIPACDKELQSPHDLVCCEHNSWITKKRNAASIPLQDEEVFDIDEAMQIDLEVDDE